MRGAELLMVAQGGAGSGGLALGGSPLLAVLLLGVLTLVPYALMVGTSFVKVSVVLGLVRNAVGTQQVPGNMIVTALAAILSIHIMAPTFAAVATAAGPVVDRALATETAPAETVRLLESAWNQAAPPIRGFLERNSTARDRGLFLDLSRASRERQSRTSGIVLAPPQPTDFSVLLPAFVVSELTAAFALGFLIFLPFLVVDLVVANVVTALGMQMLSPTTVSLPFKLLLFVLADGWYLLSRALVLSYR